METDVGTACYKCGSEEGDSFKLCPACIEKKKTARGQQVTVTIKRVQKNDLADSVMLNWKVQLLLFLGIFAASTIGVYLFTVGGQNGFIYSFILAGGLVAAIGAIGTWLLLWMNLIVYQPVFALLALLFPAAVWCFVFLKWEEAKRPFLVHLAFIVLFVSFYALFRNLELNLKDFLPRA